MNNADSKVFRETEVRLWRNYRKHPSVATRNAVFNHYWPSVQGAVWRWMIMKRMPDMANRALSFVAERLLTSAIPRFLASRQVVPRIFLHGHIFGAVQDFFRKIDHVGSKQRHQITAIRKASMALAHELGRNPMDWEIAKRLGWSELTVIQASAMRRLPGHAYVDGEEVDFLDGLGKRDECSLDDTFCDMTRKLTRQQRKLLYLRYIHGYSAEEIAALCDRSANWAWVEIQRARNTLRTVLGRN